jgi:ATP-dependent Lhr-like helicase
MPFHPSVERWFREAFGAPTPPQAQGWPPIARGESTLIVAPTGSGKTLAAFLSCLDRVMFSPVPERHARCRVLYVSPIKALAVDVERNLRVPIAGIARVAEARGDAFVIPAVAIRTGDTPARERARFQREPADVLITTPESLFLLLTSRARLALGSIETVIVDEIHALVPTKRGAHLALSLERLEQIAGRRLQRIGLSATQRPLDEVARFLGGAEERVDPARHNHDGARARRRDGPPTGRHGGTTADSDSAAPVPESGVLSPESGVATPGPVDALDHEFAQADTPPDWRPVTIVDAHARKRLSLRVEVPVEDMAKIAQPVAIPSGATSQGPVRSSIWASIHPRLLDLIRAHRSTLLFVNSRRLAERLAAALNELAGEPLVRSHHGSIARPQRLEIEDALKAGRLRALVATSSLELGIDMGAVDLVIQIEAPPSVASGLQRIGRASHQVGAVSEGVIFPKFRGDLVACAAVTAAMHEGAVESTRYPRNPLDVLAQQIVAMVAIEPWHADALFGAIRRAAPFAELSRRAFEGVLDMLSGRYPSDEFAELRPRVTWDRVGQTLTPREGALRVAIANAGTIPDRGLYGVFLAGAKPGTGRVGELDEEMVFESRVGETFLLGASSWRIEEITHDRVLVSPAPGEPGKMPFWKGDPTGRPRELGFAIGRLARELREVPPAAALDRLLRRHDLDRVAAENLLQYLADQAAATGAVPDDRTILVERSRDELGDWRICVLSPLGGKVLIPWCLAVTARLRLERGLDVETMWSDDGFVVRVPDMDEPPPPDLFVPSPAEVESLVLQQLGASALFAAKFREVAGRALLLPRRRVGRRAPLWQQRKRAADLLAVASQFGSFPAVLETFRECLRDVFDMPALVDTLQRVARRDIRVVGADTPMPSPFAASLLFSYVATFLYDGDAPLAERRAQALTVDHAQLRDLLGDAELRELLDPDVLEALERQVQGLDERHQARSADGIHDLLLRLGDLSRDELAARIATPALFAGLDGLLAARRVLAVPIGGEARFIAVEDAARYRDALGAPLPPGLPESLLEPVRDAVGDLVQRYARTHGPFTAAACAARFGLAPAVVSRALARLAGTGRVLQGEFRPGGSEREWCGADVLRQLRQRSLARLRREVEPVDPDALGRLALSWHGVGRPRRGLDALLDAVEQLQGAPLVASVLERDLLPARIEAYDPADLDRLVAAGEVTWAGLEPLGERDGRLALFLTDHLRLLWPPARTPQAASDLEQRVLDALASGGASFFAPLHAAVGGGFPNEVVDALWSLVWRGLVTNDSLHALRAYLDPPARARRREAPAFRSRRVTPPAAQGRWSLLSDRLGARPSSTEWATAVARQLLARHGVLTREAMAVEAVPGGYGAVYGVLRAMEDAGRVRRGLFVAGLGAAQFALAPALDLLRAGRDPGEVPQAVTLASTDPANPYGGVLPWPAPEGAGRPTRSAGTLVVLVDGRLAAWLGRGDRQLLAWLPDDEPRRQHTARAIAGALTRLATESPRQGLLVADVNGVPVADHPLAPLLHEAGFTRGAMGMARSRDRGRRTKDEGRGTEEEGAQRH